MEADPVRVVRGALVEQEDRIAAPGSGQRPLQAAPGCARHGRAWAGQCDVGARGLLSGEAVITRQSSQSSHVLLFGPPPGFGHCKGKPKFFAKYFFLRVGWVLVLSSLSLPISGLAADTRRISATARESLGTESDYLYLSSIPSVFYRMRNSPRLPLIKRAGMPPHWGVTATSCSSSRIAIYRALYTISVSVN